MLPPAGDPAQGGGRILRMQDDRRPGRGNRGRRLDGPSATTRVASVSPPHHAAVAPEELDVTALDNAARAMT